MDPYNLHTPIEYLKGVGPQRADILKKELQIFTLKDLLYHFPFRYEDRSKIYTVSQINSDIPYIQLKGKIGIPQTIGKQRGKRMTTLFSDETGTIELLWFKGLKWIEKIIKPGSEYVVYGKPSKFKNHFNIVHPEIELIEQFEAEKGSFMPVYSSTEKLAAKGLNSKGIYRLTKTLIPLVINEIQENISEEIIQNLKLVSRKEAFKQVHLPENNQMLERARFRLKFEELFFIQLQMLYEKAERFEKSQGHIFKTIGELFNNFYNNHLHFDLTDAQKRVLKEIRTDVGSGKQMNRLVQGDVGSGKTIVALMAMLMAADNGFQSCLMAPTEILATQHFESIGKMLKELGINIALLTGSTKANERKILFEDLQSGKINILIGTHALIEENVKFKNLALAVIDEQHRFGVAQRAKLWQKNALSPHILVMTATPIPRTLAMTLYGDLEVSVIDELPPGRKPVQTVHRFESSRVRVYGFMKEQIAKGSQVYYVFPLIEGSEKLDYRDLEEGYEIMEQYFDREQYTIGIMHGRMKQEAKDFEMNRFLKNESQILLATTVIEVGVDVPNASVMVIDGADRFGLSQLHQLRGRVGRGADQSYCILLTDFKLSAEAKLRMNTMVRTNDGFEIAEVDLRLRGAGDIRGTQQSGLVNLSIADLIKDRQILETARNFAKEIIAADRHLELPKNNILKKYLSRLIKDGQGWSRVS